MPHSIVLDVPESILSAVRRGFRRVLILEETDAVADVLSGPQPARVDLVAPAGRLSVRCTGVVHGRVAGRRAWCVGLGGRA